MKRRTMGPCSGLAGVKAKSLPAYHVASITAALTLIKEVRVCVAAGDCGSITIWRSDDGKRHAEFSRYMVTHGIIHECSLAALRTWLKEWWPQMRR